MSDTSDMSTTAKKPSRKMTLRCPRCDYGAINCTGWRHATNIVNRTCRGCRIRWQIVIRPMGETEQGALLHEIIWCEKE